MILHTEMFENLKNLGNNKAMEALSALMAFDAGAEVPELKGSVLFAFNAYVPYIKKDKEKRLAKAAAGKAATDKRWGNDSRGITDDSRGITDDSRGITADACTGTVTVTVTETEKFKESHEENFVNSVKGQSPPLALENMAALWDVLRGCWNSNNVKFTADKLFINLSYAQRDRVVGTLKTYTREQLLRGMNNYFAELAKNPKSYVFNSIYLFFEKGIEFYV